MIIIDPQDIVELKGCLFDFAEKKEWNMHTLLEALATIEFIIRYDTQNEVEEELDGSQGIY